MAAVAKAPMLKSTLACRTGGPGRRGTAAAAAGGGVGLQVRVLVEDEVEAAACCFLTREEDEDIPGALSALSVLRDVRICCFVLMFHSKLIFLFCTHPCTGWAYKGLK